MSREEFRWRQAVNNIYRSASQFIQCIRFYSFSTIIFYLLSAMIHMIHLYVHPIIKSDFWAREKTRNSKGYLLFLTFSLYSYSTYIRSTSTYRQKILEGDLRSSPSWRRVFLKLSLRRQDETILEIAFFSLKKKKKTENSKQLNGNWKLWVNLSAMLFRLRQNMEPVPYPNLAKMGTENSLEEGIL